MRIKIVLCVNTIDVDLIRDIIVWDKSEKGHINDGNLHDHSAPPDNRCDFFLRDSVSDKEKEYDSRTVDRTISDTRAALP